MNNTQMVWIARLTGQPGLFGDRLPIEAQVMAKNGAEQQTLMDVRRAELARIEGALADVRTRLEPLRAQRVLVYTDKPSSKSGVTKQFDDKGNFLGNVEEIDLINADIEKAFGLWADKLASIDDQLRLAMSEADRDLIAMSDRLLAMRVPWTEIEAGVEDASFRPVFEQKEVNARLWTPLVRQLLLPVDQVPNRFSAYQEQLEATNRLMIEDLAEIEPSDEAEWAEVLKDAQMIGSALCKGVSAAAGAAAFADSSIEDTAKSVDAIAKIVDYTSQGIVDGVVLFHEMEWEDGVGSALEMFGKAFKAGIKAFDDSPNAGDIADYVELGFKGASRVTKLSKVLRMAATGKDPSDVAAEFFGALGEIVADAADLSAVGTTDEQKAGAKQLGMGVKIATQLTARACKGKLIKALREGDSAALTSMLGDSMLILADNVSGIINQSVMLEKKQELAALKADEQLAASNRDPVFANFLERLENKDPSSRTDGVWDPAKVDSAWAKYTGSLGDKLDDKDDTDAAAIQGLMGSLDSESLEALVAERKESNARDDLEAETEGWGAQLERLSSDETQIEGVQNLQASMKRLVKSRQTMTIIATVVKGGAAVAGRFFAPLAAAGTLTQMIEQVAAAIEDLEQMRRWKRSRDWALIAVSPYTSAILGFVEEQERLYPREVTRAITLGIKMAAQAIQVGGGLLPSDHVGKLIESAAGIAEAVEDLIFDRIDADKVRDAWKITKYALDNPQDRKSNAKARRLNPTFAKYALAYGAMVEKDPVAREACAESGIDREALVDTGTNADSAARVLVQYLEVRYQRHLQVKKHYSSSDEGPKPEMWAESRDIPLEPTRWLNMVALAIENGMVEEDGVPVARAVAQLAGNCGNLFEQIEIVEAAIADGTVQVDTADEARAFAAVASADLEHLDRGLRAFQGHLSPENPDPNMALVKERLLERAESRFEALDQRLSLTLSKLERLAFESFNSPPSDETMEQIFWQSKVVLARRTALDAAQTDEARQEVSDVDGRANPFAEKSTDELKTIADAYEALVA